MAIDVALLARVCEAPGAPGFEKVIRELVVKEIDDLADEIRVDNMGNVVALKKGRSSAKRSMAAAHMDEIGFIVTHVGRLPVRGEIISGPGDFEIEVLDADPRRVKRLRIGPRKERPALRTREQRRRDATPDTNSPSNERPASPNGSESV